MVFLTSYWLLSTSFYIWNFSFANLTYCIETRGKQTNQLMDGPDVSLLIATPQRMCAFSDCDIGETERFSFFLNPFNFFSMKKEREKKKNNVWSLDL